MESNCEVDEIIFLSCYTSIRRSFYRELVTNDLKYLRDMIDTIVDVEIKDKEFIK